MRINGFEQMKAFYSWVFNNPDKARQSHISLYMFLLNQNNRSNWSEWFKCPYDLAMAGSAIGSKGTYYKALDDLTMWKLIKYKKGLNNYKAPQISIIVLSTNGQVTVPLSEQVTGQVTVPLSEPLSVLLTGKIYKLLTDNHKLVTDNIEAWIKSEKSKKVFSFKNSLIESGFDIILIEDWLKVRKDKKASNTETALNGFLREVQKTNTDKNEILRICIERDWKSFKNEWLTNLNKNGTAKNTQGITARSTHQQRQNYD